MLALAKFSLEINKVKFWHYQCIGIQYYATGLREEEDKLSLGVVTGFQLSDFCNPINEDIYGCYMATVSLNKNN